MRFLLLLFSINGKLHVWKGERWIHFL